MQSRIPKIANFNNGNVPYELQLRSNTVICNLGKYELISSNVQPEQVKFTDVVNTSTCVSKKVFHDLIFIILFHLYTFVHFIYTLSFIHVSFIHICTY